MNTKVVAVTDKDIERADQLAKRSPRELALLVVELEKERDEAKALRDAAINVATQVKRMAEDQHARAEAAEQQIAQLRSALAERWIEVGEKLPENGVHVIAYHKNGLGNGRRIRAFYARRFTIEDNSDRDDGCEEHEGTTYINEGWYEENEHAEYYIFVSDPVTDWMPLPEPPAARKALEPTGETE